MKALTLTQPWATLVAMGEKSIETRSWDTKYRGPVFITAAKKWPVDCKQVVFVPSFKAALGLTIDIVPDLPLGYVVATGKLVETFRFDDRTETLIRRRSEKGMLPRFEADFGDYTAGRFGFVFRDVRRLATPIPCRGMLSLWDVPAEVIAAVGEQLSVAVAA